MKILRTELFRSIVGLCKGYGLNAEQTLRVIHELVHLR